MNRPLNVGERRRNPRRQNQKGKKKKPEYVAQQRECLGWDCGGVVVNIVLNTNEYR